MLAVCGPRRAASVLSGGGEPVLCALVRPLLHVEGARGALMVGPRCPLGAVALLTLMCFWPPDQVAVGG